jgi:hypothetical protein
MRVILFLAICSTASAQLVPVDLPEHGVTTTTVPKGKLQIDAVSRLGYRSDGSMFLFRDGSGHETEFVGADLSLRWGFLSQGDVGIRLGYGSSNIRAFYLDDTGDNSRQYLLIDLSRRSVALSLGVRARVVNGKGFVPSIAIRTELTLDDYSDKVIFDSSLFVRGAATLAFMNRIGEKGEFGYGIGIAGIGGGSYGSGEIGSYWVGVISPIGESVLFGPEISGEFGDGGTGYGIWQPRTWFGATARIHPESWPLLHIGGRLSKGFDGEFNYELVVGAAVASIDL